MNKHRSNVRISARLIFAALVASSIPSLARAAPASQAAQKPRSVVMKRRGDCAFCVARALADRAIFGTPPLLRLPAAFALLYATTDAEFLRLKSAGADFEPRTQRTS